MFCVFVFIVFSSSFLMFLLFAFGGDDRVRTDDLMLAEHALSQLSYTPNMVWVFVGVYFFFLFLLFGLFFFYCFDFYFVCGGPGRT